MVLWFQIACLISLISGIGIIVFECLRLVKRAERAAERAEAAAQRVNPDFVLVRQENDMTLVRMAARWGADVLGAVAGGATGVDAVRRAIPRVVGLGSLNECTDVRSSNCYDTRSEVSTEDIPCDPNDWVAHASRSVTPMPEQQFFGSNSWLAESITSSGNLFVPGVHAIQSNVLNRSRVIAPRPNHSPILE